MIRVTWYFSTGNHSHAHDCENVTVAYERLKRTGIDALVFPVGTTSGVYRWDAADDRHTLEGLSASMDRIKLQNRSTEESR